MLDFCGCIWNRCLISQESGIGFDPGCQCIAAGGSGYSGVRYMYHPNPNGSCDSPLSEDDFKISIWKEDSSSTTGWIDIDILNFDSPHDPCVGWDGKPIKQED